MQDWAHWNGPDWGDVEFKRDDVLNLLPVLFGTRNETHADLVYSSAPLTDQKAASGINDNQNRSVTVEELVAQTHTQTAVRRRRQDRIVERLRRSREWTKLEDIAEWCVGKKVALSLMSGLDRKRPRAASAMH